MVSGSSNEQPVLDMSMLSKPSIAVFDVGKVLLDFDLRRLCGSIFADQSRIDRFLQDVCTPAWVLELDRGRPFASAIAESAGLFPEFARELMAFDMRWMDIFVGPVAGSVALLDRLQRKGVRTFCVTNFPAEKFDLACERFPFLSCFEGAVVSGRERLVKPDPAIFHVLLERYQLDPSHCLFIDDVAANVESAMTIGMHGHRFIDAPSLSGELVAQGLLPEA
jgi:2-haloacid dehalogenase